MRIRSIKPEFWRSRDIAALSIEDRLLFVGLWSYVDDNGVGRDEVALIAADLFAHDLSVSPHDTLTRIHDGLQRLHAANLIARYEVDGADFFEVTAWKRHQKINRPSPGRYPTSDHESAVTHESSVSPHDSLRAGTEEQGNRGTGEQGKRNATRSGAADAPPRAEADPTAQTIVAAWLDGQDQRPPATVIGQVSKIVKQLLDDDQPAEDVTAALTEWNNRGLHPATIPSVLHGLRSSRPNYTSGSDRRMAAGADRHQRLNAYQRPTDPFAVNQPALPAQETP